MTFRNPNVRLPKDGRTYSIVVVSRISTIHQDERSLDDQGAGCKHEVETEYPGPFNYHTLQSRGSGEHLDRKELEQLKDLIETGKVDIVITEDLGRICRRNRAIDFCELCQDYNTRLVAINDRVDTDEEGWEDAAAMATWHHSRSNRDTSNRIRRSLNNRFDNGQLIERPIYGYIVPSGAKNDSELQKDSAAEPVIFDIFRRLLDGASYSEIADWLNEQQIPTGPYCRNKKWSCKSLSRFVHQRLLKGERIRNRLISKRVNKTGRHRSIKAPAKILRVRKCPDLAFFDAAYYDHVIRVLDARNAKYRRAKGGELDVRTGVPRSRTEWPGQQICCGVCGRQLYWTRCGEAKGLLCSGAQAYTCWNSLLLSGERCVSMITAAVIQEIRSIPNFDAVLATAIAQQISTGPDEGIKRHKDLERSLRTAESGLTNVMRAIEAAPTSAALIQRLNELEAEVAERKYELQSSLKVPATNSVPPTLQELTILVDGLFSSLLTDDPEAGRILRRLIPSMYVLPYQCCDGKSIEARVHLTINLAAILGPLPGDELAPEIITRQLIVDLFDLPQRVKFLGPVMELTPQLKEREIAARLGIKQPAVQYAKKLFRVMQELGLDDPYVRLNEPPTKGKTRMRRHRHPRYEFQPLAGFPMT